MNEKEETILDIFKAKLLHSNDFPKENSVVEVCRNKIMNLVEVICSQIQSDCPYLLNSRGRKQLLTAGSDIDFDIISDWLHNESLSLPPLELVCFLHRCGIMQITTFLYYKPEFCSEISSQLVEIVTRKFPRNEDREAAEDIVKLVLSSLINVGCYSLREIFSLSSSLLESFTASLIESLFSSGKDLEVEFLSSIIKDKTAFGSGLISFAAFLFNSLLVHDASTCNVQAALAVHHKQWTSQHVPDKFKHLFYQLEKLLGKEGIVKEIELAIEDKKINLKYLLFAVSLMSIKSTEYADFMKASADKWFKQALKERCEFSLGLALLVTRHYCTEVSKYYVAYANWFGSIQAKAVLTFRFLFDFLSKLVPFEPAVFLKIQVTKVPLCPSSCYDVIGDYASLAKTRLADMNQVHEYISLFNDFHETLSEQEDSDVKRVLAYFSESGEVVKAVMEASVFRRQYYEKIFLPHLLSVPKGSDETRDQLIIKLNTLGKIPSSLYRSWSKGS